MFTTNKWHGPHTNQAHNTTTTNIPDNDHLSFPLFPLDGDRFHTSFALPYPGQRFNIPNSLDDPAPTNIGDMEVDNAFDSTPPASEDENEMESVYNADDDDGTDDDVNDDDDDDVHSEHVDSDYDNVDDADGDEDSEDEIEAFFRDAVDSTTLDKSKESASRR